MRQPLRELTLCWLVFTCLFTARPSTAQPFTLDDKIKPVEITLEPLHTGNPKSEGKIYRADITQTDPAQYFYVQGLSIYSPAYFGLTSADPSSAIKVSLHKEIWDQPNIRGETDRAGHWEAKFKTSGDFGIRVTPSKVPAKYAMLVWVGNEIEAPLPSPFKLSASAPPRGGAAALSTTSVVFGLLIAAISAAVLYKVKAARVFLLIGSLLFAPFAYRTLKAQGDYGKAVAEMLDQLKSFLEHQESVKDFWESLQALSKDEATPDESQRGPSVPSTCLDATWQIPPDQRGTAGKWYQDCQCMTNAVDKLRKNRQMLEKLRILVANQKAFVDKATALGNSFSQLHTVLGLQWIGIKKHDIDEPYDQFKTISNQKHQALMAAIEKDLKDISDCETRFGEKDWYQKFGFVYYEFLYAAYKPSF